MFAVKVLSVLTLFLTTSITSGDAAMNRDEQIAALARQLEQRYGFQIIYRDFSVPVEKKLVFKLADKKGYEYLARFLTIFAEEVDKYPADFFQHSRLKAVILVKRHFYNEKPVEGLYDSGANVIFIDFWRNRKNILRQRWNIHHELFHMIEIEARRGGNDFSGWVASADKSFQYSPDPRPRSTETRSRFSAPLVPGFVSDYSMTSAVEDRAEIFACLMVASQNKLLLKWTEKDLILKEKVAALKGFLANYCAGMDERFWMQIRTGQHSVEE